MFSKLFKKIKEGFTLIEMTVVILTTSILLVGFTSFLVFFSNIHAHETETMNETNSAFYMKNAISNHIEQFNYTYEDGVDFNFDASTKLVDNSNMFSVLSAQYESEAGYYSGVIFRDYKFVNTTYDAEGDVVKYSHFMYIEKIYTFKETYDPVVYSERQLRTIAADSTKVESYEENEVVVYTALSHMTLQIKNIEETGIKPNCKKFVITIMYDYETNDAPQGKQSLDFNKYVYFM